MRLELPGTSFSAWVLIDNVEADIYEPRYDKDDNGAVAKCWIESKAGENFSVHWCDAMQTHNSSVTVYVDGIEVWGGVTVREQCKEFGDWEMYVDSVVISPSTSRLLTFSKLQTTDEEDLDTAHFTSIGEIKIEIQYAEITLSTNQSSLSENAEFDTSQQLSGEQKIHENSKKADSHQAKLGEIIEHDDDELLFYDIGRKIADVGTFVFHYHPREILVAQGIIPQPAATQRSPKPHTPDVIVDSDPDDDGLVLDGILGEISKLQRKVESLRNKRKRLQPEPKADVPKAKREKTAHNRPLAEPAVIDLTELSD